MNRRLFYLVKPLIPRRVQISLRRTLVAARRERYSRVWPIDEDAGTKPPGWTGWPENKSFALVLTHDVETKKGLGKCVDLSRLEQELGFTSSFNFVPKRYDVSPQLRTFLTNAGFEVGVHGLYHDGKYYFSRTIFRQRAEEINRFLKEWNSVGFRSPSMLHNLAWIHDLNIEYDCSTFDTDPFEPQSDGIGTIFPFIVRDDGIGSGYVELPYTLVQDLTLFILLQENNIDIWKRKLDWVVEHGGMALLNTHPDYMSFSGRRLSLEEYPVRYYREFLEYVRDRYAGTYWHALPRDVARYCSASLPG